MIDAAPHMELLPEDHPLLRRKSKRIVKIDDIVRNIAASMIDVMIKSQGIGLAAPQVGISRQIIVVLVNEEPRVMINPEILEISKEYCTMNEGCLSFPGKYLDIERPDKVKIKYRCLSGKPMVEWYEGLEARCILHEIDHLQGVVFLDRVDT
jgi:peptide deformylase